MDYDYIKVCAEPPAKFVEIQPGDGTRYEFVIVDFNEDNLWIGGSLMSGYIFRKASIVKAIDEVEHYHGFLNKMSSGAVPHYVGYIAEHNRLKQNIGAKYWVARAMIMAAYKVLQDWETEEQEMFESLGKISARCIEPDEL
jgi:hypothetical protein